MNIKFIKNKEEFSPKIQCAKCGECCKGFSNEKLVVLFPIDLQTIPAVLKIEKDEFLKKYCESSTLHTAVKEVTLYTLKYIDGQCIFLKDNLCEIFSFKPIQCQRAPFNFFWSGTIEYKYKCMQNIYIPDSWSSEYYDKELLDSLFKQST